jgi:hypothetical protein
MMVVRAGVGVNLRPRLWSLDEASAVAGRLYGGDKLLEPDVRLALNGRLLGGEVDGRGDAVEVVQLLLDSRRAGGAGHSLEVEPDGPLLGCHSHSHPLQSTSTFSTPATRESSEVTARVQWLQLMAETA